MIAASKLNIHSYSASVFDPFDDGLMRLYTVAAVKRSPTLAAGNYCGETVTQLEQALTSRSPSTSPKEP